MPDITPRSLDLDKDKGLTIRWSDGRVSFYPVNLLRRLSPSAEAREMRKAIAANPLTVLPSSTSSSEPLRAVDAELVGNYAVRIRFSDGHDTGLYAWPYLRSIDPNQPPADASAQPGEPDR
ncbi:MAG: DUF971 domain-containing protein [Phycisphaeraceae bacterium]